MAKSEKSGNTDTSSQRIITPEFRVSYPHVFKATNFKGKGDLTYSVTMLFKKTQDLTVLKLAMKHAKIAKFGPDKSKWPEELMSPITDGDLPKYAANEGYKGHWAIKASCREDRKPGVVDEDCQPMVDASAFYPGCYARAEVYCHAWEYMGKEGIRFALNHVQKTRDGKSLSNRKSAEDTFSPITAGAEDDVGDDASDEDFK